MTAAAIIAAFGSTVFDILSTHIARSADRPGDNLVIRERVPWYRWRGWWLLRAGLTVAVVWALLATPAAWAPWAVIAWSAVVGVIGLRNLANARRVARRPP